MLKLANAVAWATEQAADGPHQIDRLMKIVMIRVRTGRLDAVTR